MKTVVQNCKWACSGPQDSVCSGTRGRCDGGEVVAEGSRKLWVMHGQ